jgi:hypothetical protein
VKSKPSRTPEQYRTKEIQGRISFARKRAAFGKQYATETGAYELANMIKSLRAFPIIPQKSDSLTLDQYVRTRRARTAFYLLKAATISSKSLQLIAKALDAIDADLGENPSQDNIIMAYEKAYEKCDAKRAPTFSELRETFLAMFGERCWRGAHRDTSERASDFPVRKTLKSLELPLTEDKLGRPPRTGPKKPRTQWGEPTKVFATFKSGNRRRLEQ